MGWFNYYGLIAVVIILVPNILFAIFDKAKSALRPQNKVFLILEQIGRYGCMGFMIFNIPCTYFNFWFDGALLAYLIGGGVLLLVYCLGWTVFKNGKSLASRLWLSITPAVLFAFCGIMLLSIPLLICSVLFAVGHIYISIKN